MEGVYFVRVQAGEDANIDADSDATNRPTKNPLGDRGLPFRLVSHKQAIGTCSERRNGYVVASEGRNNATFLCKS